MRQCDRFIAAFGDLLARKAEQDFKGKTFTVVGVYPGYVNDGDDQVALFANLKCDELELSVQLPGVLFTAECDTIEDVTETIADEFPGDPAAQKALAVWEKAENNNEEILNL